MNEVRYWTTDWRRAGRIAAATGDTARTVVLTTDDSVEHAASVDVVRSAERLVSLLRDGTPYERILIIRDARVGSAEDEFLLLFEVTKALLATRPEHDVRLVYAYVQEGDEVRPECAAAGAFAKVVASERPAFRYRTVATADTDLTALLAEFDQPDDAVEVRHHGGERLVRHLRPLPAPPAGALPVRDGGVYLITGGLGGLGRIIAGELARRARVDLVLTGRSPVDVRAVADLERTGARVHYVQADIATPDGVATVVGQAKARFGRLAGVIHAAGVVRDSFLLKKTAPDATAVLAAKVLGTPLLDEALRDEPLDFFVLFSSLAGTLGNVGQADYGFANSYLDHYARWRSGRRPGRTVAVAWPLWDEGAMRDDATRDRARAELGLHPLSTSEGVEAFWGALATGAEHVVVVKGESRTWDLLAPAPAGPPRNETPALRRRTRDYLAALVSRFTKLPVAQLGTDVSFGRYGIESIMIIAMVEELERDLGPLSKTLFFEYDSIDRLADHLLRTKSAELRAKFGLAAPERPRVPAAEPPAPARRSAKWDLLVARSRTSQPRTEAVPDGIAIVGLAGRYPQAPDLDAFWANLRDGKDCVTEVPARRWDHERYFDEEKAKPGRTYGRWGGFVDGVELFDPLFFGIAPAEAEFLDPQERLFLETAWHAVEDAGYARKELAGEKVGVFVGVMFGLYQLLATDRYGGWLNGNSSYASVANRVSYFFDFHGPSMTIDTMCSSSLVAVHQACASIRNGESELAIAGGVNVISHPAKYVQLSQGAFLSTDGRCRAFGAGGDGYVPGEGVGAVLLKPLRKAVADGDHVYGVIKGSAVNAGGRTSAYTVPNPEAQAELITTALGDAGVDPGGISYVEAHGTGTALGDPIEISGLTKAYRSADLAPGACAIGSVKSNIGHLESAAGIAALTKVLLQLRHRRLVPSLHANPLNPLIDFEDSPFAVQRELSDWEPTTPDGRRLPRRAAVSAFGAGGTNAHLIVEEPPDDMAHRPDDADGEQVFVLSARDDAALDDLVHAMLVHVGGGPAAHDPATGVATAGEIRAAVRAVVAEVLEVDPAELDDDEHYADLGLDAYGLAAAGQGLGERLGLGAPVEVLHEHPTVTRTTGHLTAALGLTGDTVEDTGFPLADLAFTLQVGREPMSARLAITASDVDGLRRGLASYLERRTDVYGVRYGSTEEYERHLRPLLKHELVGTITGQMLAEGRLDDVAELWIMGADVDWSSLWENRRPRRLSLPPRPFAREVHWITPVGPGDPLVPAQAPSGERAPAPAPRAVPERATRREDVLADLKRCFGAVLRIPEERLRERVPFEEYGIDSVSIMRLNRMLGETYGELPTSLLFTYRSLDSLAKYLCANDREPRPAGDSAPATVQPRRDEPVTPSGDIAIIGLSGRYPRAATLAEFEANLVAGRDCVTEIPSDRWDHRDYPDVTCRWGGFVDDPLTFDPSFFGVAPNTAAYMDPQERMFVQSVWHAVEDAGYTPDTLTGVTEDDRRANVAVYAGVTFNEYGLFAAADFGAGKDVPIDSQLYSVANRVSYLLNLRGASLVVDTACSSSLYAIHLACRAIRDGDCEVAIAGGVNLNLHPGKYVTLDMFNFLAPDGHCKSFGAGGNGYVPADGVGAVVLKPLAQAERDGDHIHGVIKGSAVNHGGRTNGYTVPNPVAQADVVSSALEAAGVPPESISYLEAHGTGTQLGDSIEIEALSNVFGTPADGRPRPIGSVKSTIGHAEAAAGISQLTKVLLQMRTGQLFASRLNSDRLNPEIDFERLRFRVQTSTEPWRPPSQYPRRAGVSSFGVGGVNVHLVVEEYQGGRLAPPAPEVPQWVRLSAMNHDALVRYVAALRRELADGAPPLADLAFTLRTGRRELPYRVAFVAASHAELAGQLDAYLTARGENVAADGVFTGDVRSGVDSGSGDPADLRERARLWVGGVDVSDGDTAGRRVSLPGYPFEKETYWLYREPVRSARAPVAAPVAAPVEVAVVPDPVPAPEPPPAVEAEVTGPVGDRLAELMGELAEAFPDERHPMMTDFVQDDLADLLGFTEGRLPESDRGFFDLGMDSISANQMHSRLEQFFGLELDLQLFFNYPTIKDVAEYLLGLLDVDNYEPPVDVPQAEPTEVQAPDIDTMSEAELVALLEGEIAREGLQDADIEDEETPVEPDPVLSADIDAMGEAELVALLEGEIAREGLQDADIEDEEVPETETHEEPEIDIADADLILSADIELMSEQELVALLENEIARNTDVRNSVA